MEQNKLSSPSQKNKGSFSISPVVYESLMKNASYMQIAAYLVLARYTDTTGQYCSAGRTAIRKRLGIGDEQADRALQSLMQLFTCPIKGDMVGSRLVYSAAEWKNANDDTLERPTFQSQVRFVLDQFDLDTSSNERIWFSNELVDGYGIFKQPLRKLKRLGDLSARLLLVLYKENRMEQFGGVAPHLCRRTYSTLNTNTEHKGFGLWQCAPGEIYIDPTLSLAVLKTSSLGTGDDEIKENESIVIRALNGLQAAGFIYEMVTVLDGPPDIESNVTYELDMRGRHGYKPKNEEGLGGLTAKLAGLWGKSVAKSGAVFTGKYAAILEVGGSPSCSGIFRLRFRVANHKNYGVSAAFRRILESHLEWKQLFEGLLAAYDE